MSPRVEERDDPGGHIVQNRGPAKRTGAGSPFWGVTCGDRADGTDIDHRQGGAPVDYREFVQAVEARAALSREESADVTRATLEALSRLLSEVASRDLALQVPEELRDPLRQGMDPHARRSLRDTVRNVSKRTGLSEAEADRGIRAALATLREAAGAEYDKAMSQLGKEFTSVVQT